MESRHRRDGGATAPRQTFKIPIKLGGLHTREQRELSRCQSVSRLPLKSNKDLAPEQACAPHGRAPFCLARPPFEVGGTSSSPKSRSPDRRRSSAPGGRARIAKRTVRRCDRERGRIRRRSRGSQSGLSAGSPPGLNGATLEDAPRVRNAMTEDERASSACGGPSPIGSPSLGGDRSRGRSVLCTSEPDIEWYDAIHATCLGCVNCIG